MINLRTIINKLLVSFVISLALFHSLEINITLYILIVFTIWIFVVLNVKIYNNIDLYNSIIAICFGNLIAYIIAVFLFYDISNAGIMEILSVYIYLFFLLAVTVKSCIIYSEKKKNTTVTLKLMKKRQRDLDRLLYYVKLFNIIALNGRWGTGKSLLISELKKLEEIKNNYDVIEIDILACNLNELQLILIKEIERVMYKNRSISKYSNDLKEFLGNKSIITKLQGLIFDNNQSYTEAIRGLQQELTKLDKKILIVYEDIDRVNEVEIIKKLFSINEKLSSERIKIIFQYHEENLIERGFTNEYLEKYMPFKTNVTEINFFETLSFIFRESNYDENLLKIEDFEFLREYSQPYRYKVLKREINLVVGNICFRKVANFLNELIKSLENKDYKQNKETVIAFFFTKHFIPSVYVKLNIDEGLLETIKFKLDKEFYTMPELINLDSSEEISKEDFEALFKNEENKINFGVLKLFDYKNLKIISITDVKSRFQSILEEPVGDLNERNSNDKKDRIIWNLLAPGKSEFTDYEFAGNKLIDDVLSKSEEDWFAAYSVYDNELFYLDKKETDNQSIFLMGVPQFIELFKSLRIIGAESEYVKKLVDLYFMLDEIKSIDHELVQTLNFCDLKSTDLYVYILKKFNKLEIIGNLNSEECFFNFINKFLIKALPQLGILNINRHSFSFINNTSLVGYEDRITGELVNICGNLNELKEKFSLYLQLGENDKTISLKNKQNFYQEHNQLTETFNTILDFIKKLIDIINSDHQISIMERRICTSMSTKSQLRNQKEFDRLFKIMQEDSGRMENILKSYKDGKITIHEIDKLIETLTVSGPT